MAGVSEHTLELVRAAMRQQLPNSPSHYDKVYKEECCFSFETPYAPDGLFINMVTWQSFSKAFLKLDSRRSGNYLYLNEKWQKVLKPQPPASSEVVKPEKLAIGVDGGFLTENEMYDIVKEHKLVVLDSDGIEIATVCLPEDQLPEVVNDSIKAIIAHVSSKPEGMSEVWEEERKVSRYAENLEQLDEGLGKWGRQIPADSSQWQCDETGVRENLWLNLSTGFIGSGRQNYNGTGGNGAALRHYEATGKKYPLVVKLGTITPNGADVYSYAADEDDMVLDPHLAKHLEHWGINRISLQKTEKTMAELQIDLNMAFEFDKITEKGSSLQPIYGPGLVGLKNLGNSCYMNSVLQLLYSVPPVQKRYADAAQKIFETAPIVHIHSDFPTQMAKVGVAITQGKGGSEPMPPAVPGAGGPVSGETGALDSTSGPEGGLAPIAIKPAAFKALVGQGDPEFSSARQQDAVEYLQHLLELMTKEEKVHSDRLGTAPDLPSFTADSFSFKIEDRIQCHHTQAVSYSTAITTNLGLGIPLEAAINSAELQEYKERENKRAKLEEESKAEANGLENGGPAKHHETKKSEKEEPVLPKVPFSACVERWAGDEVMEGYFSAAANAFTTAFKRTRFATFPPYLFLYMRRYLISSDWTPKKMEVLVDVPETLDLEFLRTPGPQPGERLQPEAASGEQSPMDTTTADDSLSTMIVTELMSMGFSENGSRRAVAATKGGNTQVAMDWVLSHMEDPDFNDPLPAAGASTVGEDELRSVMNMGFLADQAKAALIACDNNIAGAVDWLLSHPDLNAAVDDILSSVAEQNSPPGPSPEPRLDDGKGQYTLVGFISHMGSNTACGHYVAHIKKGDRWVICNDEKVAISEHPPKDIGYAYLFKRNDV